MDKMHGNAFTCWSKFEKKDFFNFLISENVENISFSFASFKISFLSSSALERCLNKGIS